MNYLDVYFSRVNHFGETTSERIKNTGIVAFEQWLAQSPFTVTNLSVERGLYFSGIIQTSKDIEEKKLMYLYVANDIPIQVGDILTWKQDNGATEKWLLLQEIHKVHPTYRTFQIIKCNYQLKWIDDDGRLQKSWAYVVSSVDSMIKGNFRMWHSLISPQPNKYAEIIIPRQTVDRGTNFIIEDEGWTMIEADFTSVEGIMYISLTESKVNYQYDDRNVDVADTDKLQFPILAPMYTVGDSLIPDFGENTFTEWDIELIPEESFTSVAQGEDGIWRAVSAGQGIVTMRLKDRPAVTKQFELTINEPEVEFSAYIDGEDKIRLDRYAKYTLTGTTTISGEVQFSIDNNQYATISEKGNNSCIIHANSKNKLGKIILSATYNNITYTKQIEIIPLW